MMMLDQKDNSGCTPLHYASKMGHLATTEALIKLGAKTDSKTNQRESALHFAAR